MNARQTVARVLAATLTLSAAGLMPRCEAARVALQNDPHRRRASAGCPAYWVLRSVSTTGVVSTERKPHQPAANANAAPATLPSASTASSVTSKLKSGFDMA